jgi:hypothetical protein
MFKACLRNVWVIIGLVIVVLGWGPLFGIIVLYELGLWPDPNPNPIGPGLLFFVSFFPAVICLGIGVSWECYKRWRDPPMLSERPAGNDESDTSVQALPWYRYPAVRIIAGVGGVFLLGYGVMNLTGSQTRGAASAMVIGVVIIFWAILGRVPEWFNR